MLLLGKCNGSKAKVSDKRPVQYIITLVGQETILYPLGCSQTTFSKAQSDEYRTEKLNINILWSFISISSVFGLVGGERGKQSQLTNFSLYFSHYQCCFI